jgi:hypothetical protein
MFERKAFGRAAVRSGEGVWRGGQAVLVALVLPLLAANAGAVDARGGQFISFTNFSGFTRAAGQRAREVVLTSPEITAAISWDELVASWDVDLPRSGYLKVEARAIHPHGVTKYFTMGLWSADPSLHPRESVPRQRDADGNVTTDTLSLTEPCRRFQVRLTLGSDEERRPKLKFLGICLTDTKAPRRRCRRIGRPGGRCCPCRSVRRWRIRTATCCAVPPRCRCS